MPSVFETVTTVLAQGDNTSKLGTVVGADGQQTTSLVNAAAPAILGAIADKTAEPGGLGAVTGLLDGFDESLLGDPGGFLGSGDPRIGSELLDGILGAKRTAMVSALALHTGAGESVISRLLPMLAPLVMGVLKHRQRRDNLDAAGLATLLNSEKGDLVKGGGFDFASLAPAGAQAAMVGGGNSIAAAAVGTAGNAARSAVASAVDTDAVGPVGGMAGSAKETVDSAKETTTGGAEGRGANWVPWIVAGLATVLILGWLLSQCDNGDSAETDAAAGNSGQTDAETTGDDEQAEGSGDDGDASSGSEDADAASTDDGGDLDVAALQQAVDAALAAAGSTGLTGTVLDDGTVELAGTVGSDEAKAAAEVALDGIDGITAVSNGIEVEPAGDQADEQPTINEELSLDPITFEVSSAQITAAGQAVLDQAAGYLTANTDVTVEIAGHTDADGRDAANLVLSQARAESVKAYLEAKGVDGGRMTAKGYGEAQPVASNDTAAGKAENRRIEFVIL